MGGHEKNLSDTTDSAQSIGGRWITQGLFDLPHYLLLGGDRSGVFDLRLKCAVYIGWSTQLCTADISAAKLILLADGKRVAKLKPRARVRQHRVRNHPRSAPSLSNQQQGRFAIFHAQKLARSRVWRNRSNRVVNAL